MATNSELALLSSAAYENYLADMQLPQGWTYLIGLTARPSGLRSATIGLILMAKVGF